ncbi:DUF2589 domain-containing protein [Caldalkalibacillus salinus]|uniref:DUF2589 domain-containing protein n=1 Tax=Caldalkalibacillus salinus TaxID=2803787 RepID=UPI001923039E|nr:DUF2589 domain-containing protein [Caldalkalibacillus salinus]
MSMPMQVKQSVPFRHLVGGPLISLIQAQAQALQASLEFIQRVGFEPEQEEDQQSVGKARTMTLSYDHYESNGERRVADVQIPILSLVNIPYVRIENTTFEWQVKITDIKAVPIQPAEAEGNKQQGLYDDWLSSSPYRPDLRAAYTPYTQTGTSHMKVKMTAVQDTLPEGTQRIQSKLSHPMTLNEEHHA